jgi:hypothetical protein
MMDVIELRPADAPPGAVALAPTSLYPNEVKFLYAVPALSVVPERFKSGLEQTDGALRPRPMGHVLYGSTED